MGVWEYITYYDNNSHIILDSVPKWSMPIISGQVKLMSSNLKSWVQSYPRFIEEEAETRKCQRSCPHPHRAGTRRDPGRPILQSSLLITVWGQLHRALYDSSADKRRRVGHNGAREISRAGRGEVCQAQELESHAENNKDSLETHQESEVPEFSLGEPTKGTRLLAVIPKSVRGQRTTHHPAERLSRKNQHSQESK